jgi:SagB-type dehydrogenase family enzyme
VQTYLYVKPDRIEGLASGTYYHHPDRHRLSLLATQVHMDRELFPKSQAIFDESAFALFLVGQLDAIAPLYGDLARDFCLIEAGLMSQLLETAAADYQIGLCQIGGLDFQPIRHLFALGENHIYLHCLLGGSLDADHLDPRRFLAEFDEIRPFLELADKEEGATVPPHAPSLQPAGSPVRLSAETLRDFLQGKLPEYMVPASFMFLDALPLSANGKVDRKALPVPESIGAESAAAHVDPQTKMEQVIAGIWQEVLQVDKVGIRDNFFDLGGNSVHVVRIHSKLRHALDVDIPIVKMFNYPTVSSLAEFLSEVQSGEDSLQQSHERADARRALRKKRQQSKANRSESHEGR